MYAYIYICYLQNFENHLLIALSLSRFRSVPLALLQHYRSTCDTKNLQIFLGQAHKFPAHTLCLYLCVFVRGCSFDRRLLKPSTKYIVQYTIYALYRQLPLAIIGNCKWVSLLAFILFISHSIGRFQPIMFLVSTCFSLLLFKLQFCLVNLLAT